MPPEHDAWWVDPQGLVHKIKVRPTGKSGAYRVSDCGVQPNLVESILETYWTHWGLNREVVYKWALERQRHLVKGHQRALFRACNLLDLLEANEQDPDR
jgi:hypothetical protein